MQNILLAIFGTVLVSSLMLLLTISEREVSCDDEKIKGRK
jgi:hypothetical protein